MSYIEIADDEIMFVSPGVCPPFGVRVHVCEGQFSYLGFVKTFKLEAVMEKPDGKRANDRNCRFCGEALVRETPTGDGGTE